MLYFTLAELKAESLDVFHPGFIDKLIELRERLDKPINPTSCVRTSKYNKEIGGSVRSLHISDLPTRKGQKGCMAIDIAIPNPAYKVELIKLALSLDWSVGINDKKHFVHLDRRVDIGEPQAIFSY